MSCHTTGSKWAPPLPGPSAQRMHEQPPSHQGTTWHLVPPHITRHLGPGMHVLLSVAGRTEHQVPLAAGNPTASALRALGAIQVWRLFLPHSVRAGFAHLAVSPHTSFPATSWKEDVCAICISYWRHLSPRWDKHIQIYIMYMHDISKMYPKHSLYFVLQSPLWVLEYQLRMEYSIWTPILKTYYTAPFTK